ncbi:MAG TPA: ABC transporter substrate-binding protein [Sedimenticola thiotaurini]|uniref:ABC transporter substrate-binding protein n=1 Tax=Sedimenticola thiotaurini TaxID=1543721 RepID=A0A831RLJ0_9GAMM|nr:ABC transporter substrate-binding protein [Sedimenticola thiotaurini]
MTRLVTGVVLGSMLAAGAVAEELTVVSFGGAYGAAQKKHMLDPYTAKTGNKLLFEDYSGGIAEIKAQVEAGNIQWDVVDIEVIDLERACSEGLLEEIPTSILAPGDDGTPAEQDFIPEALANECGVGNIVWTIVYAYNEKTIGATRPTTIGDFFDTAKIPGKRAMRKRPQVNLEWALIADGVAPDKVYEVLATEAGQKRAFAKLDTIKKDIVWFDSWSQVPQLLNDGGAILGQSANGRIFNAIKEDGKPFKMVWDAHIYDLDVWSVVKGTRKMDLAFDFIRFATGTKPLSGMPDVAYGPTRKSSMALVDPKVVPDLPTSHLKEGIKANGIFWADYGESLGEKFNEWLLQ